jgi:butyrate kinase
MLKEKTMNHPGRITGNMPATEYQDVDMEPKISHDEINILVINLGSTSTKFAVYKNDEAVFSEVIRHHLENLDGYEDIWDQYEFRKSVIINRLEQMEIPLERFDVIVSRGGTVKPVPSGIYNITLPMLADMKSKVYGNHPTNVGAQVAFDLANRLKIPAVTVDPPVTDEMSALAKYSGLPHIQRQSSFHALSQKATGRKAAEILGKPYHQLNLIILHMGGGISIGAHQHGKVVDVNNALNGDGPFSPERSGTLPAGQLIDLCYSGQYTQAEMHKLICGQGGLKAYLGTTDLFAVEKRIAKGDEKAAEVFEAMGYQTAKEIGAAAVVMDGEVDAIILTGQLAFSQRLVNIIKRKTSFIAPIHSFPGENEMDALALGALRYMKGEEAGLSY